MSAMHDSSCPIMERGCHSVGGYSVNHDRGVKGDCRCGAKCQCELIDRVRREEREKKMAAADIAFLDAMVAREHLADLAAKVKALATRGIGARVIDGELVTYALVERDEVLALLNGTASEKVSD